MDDTDRLRRLLIVVGLLVLIAPLLMMSFMWLLMGSVMGPMGAPGFLGLLPLLLAVGIGYGGYRLLKSDGDRGEAVSDGDTDPIERLKQQYTSGEITEAEFERRVDRQLDDATRSDSSSETSVDAPEERDSAFER